MKATQSWSAIDSKLLIKEVAGRLDQPTRRAFLRQSIGLGSLVMLSDCDITDGLGAENALRAISRMNDRVQAWLFDKDRLAPEYPESAITDPFPFNAFYKQEEAPDVDPSDFALEASGLVDSKASWTLAELNQLPQVSQITRHVCIEGWSAIGQWSGIRFSDFLVRIGADRRAKYVGFKCADGYSTSIDMATALHPQTQLTLRFRNRTLPRQYGFPMKLRVPTKLGFKNPKHITTIIVTNDFPGGFWENYGYNWFSGL